MASINLKDMTLKDILKLDLDILKDMDESEIKDIDTRGLGRVRTIMEIIRVKKKGYKDCRDYQEHLAKDHGFKNYVSYYNALFQKIGYKNSKEYQNEWKYKHGLSNPMDKNIYCPLYLGVHIAENALSKVFENVQRMPINNHGYDFVCGKGYKIDVKSSCLQKQSEANTLILKFMIRKNKDCDYFLLIGFDNRKDLNPLHVWLINADEIIRTRKLNELHSLSIPNTPRSIKLFKKYEMIDKLENVICMCKEIKKTYNM